VVNATIAGDIDFAPFGEKFDDGHADTVQSAVSLVRSSGKLSTEFSARSLRTRGNRKLFGSNVGFLGLDFAHDVIAT